MNFKEAYEKLKEGKAVKLPTWKGYWLLEDGSIKMYCRNGEVLDIRETSDVLYTIESITSDKWEVCEKTLVENNKNIRYLDTIQKQEKLNRVFSVDEEGPGGAHHRYHIETNEDVPKHVAVIQFQTGPRNVEGSVSGVLGVDLLEIVRDTLISFQKGPFSSLYNEKALAHIEKALEYQNKRVEDRIARNVLGKNEK